MLMLLAARALRDRLRNQESEVETLSEHQRQCILTEQLKLSKIELDLRNIRADRRRAQEMVNELKARWLSTQVLPRNSGNESNSKSLPFPEASHLLC